MTWSRGRPRSAPTDAQRNELRRLYVDVPQEVLVRHQWQTPAGQAFLEFARKLADEHDVPLTWVAQECDIPGPVLQQVMTRPTARPTTRRKITYPKGESQ